MTPYDIPELYDALHSSHTNDVHFYADIAKRVGAKNILERFCGTGRLLIPLVSYVEQAILDEKQEHNDLHIVGLDYNASMLAVLQNRISELPIHTQQYLEVIEGDARVFIGEDRLFDLIIDAFGSFHILTSVESQLAALECVVKSLKKGGVYVLDVWNPSFNVLSGAIGPERVEVINKTNLSDGSILIRKCSNKYNSVNQILTKSFFIDVFSPDGSHLRSYFQQENLQIIFPHELFLLLERVGFEIVQVFGGYNRNRLSESSNRILLACQMKQSEELG